VTTDGDHWVVIPFPEDAGPPTDVTRFRDGVVALTPRGLYRLEGAAVDGQADIAGMSGVADATATLIAPVDDAKASAAGAPAKKKPRSPFEVSDFFCTAPLAVMNAVLYAGGQRGGTLTDSWNERPRARIVEGCVELRFSSPRRRWTPAVAGSRATQIDTRRRCVACFQQSDERAKRTTLRSSFGVSS